MVRGENRVDAVPLRRSPVDDIQPRDTKLRSGDLMVVLRKYNDEVQIASIKDDKYDDILADKNPMLVRHTEMGCLR